MKNACKHKQHKHNLVNFLGGWKKIQTLFINLSSERRAKYRVKAKIIKAKITGYEHDSEINDCHTGRQCSAVAAPPLTDSFVRQQVTWSPSSWAAFRFPHRSLGRATKALLTSLNRETPAEGSGVGRAPHRDFKAEEFLLLWPIFTEQRKGRGLKYFVTPKNARHWPRWNSKPMRHKYGFAGGKRIHSKARKLSITTKHWRPF